MLWAVAAGCRERWRPNEGLGMDFRFSLPFGGGLAYGPVFWVTFALWNLAELTLSARRRSGSTSRSHDRGSFRLHFLLITTAVSLDFASALSLPSLRIESAAETLFALGIGCVVAGTSLRWWAIFTLGRHFTVDVATQAAQPVIESGPYRCVRHPSYAGLLLALFGFGLSLGDWAGLLAMILLPACPFAYRIAVEETALRSELGQPYEKYMSRTWRLIPYLL
jgi:protein-S-isoprenylcysteine O-methyltransferase